MASRNNRRKVKLKLLPQLQLRFFFFKAGIPTVAKLDYDAKYQGKLSYASHQFSILCLRHQGGGKKKKA